ncbi:MAG: ParB N-terminal domain-containing protein [Candidatus Thermoplasmatota archaeon]|nr:ParB N-terminal domain-containing protein [Candidatus Thermoplasmatota archaeon]MEC7065199.1 ParB N-terminal domain-containing protein [Candidatus Thermoplasmatota archaeon]MEC8399571.1 ParB N-terminal domain-containing protein [Candidatus Thermoplasmatota archaeon]MEC8519515.1 ParB N-terminal domain-containing protein [Candidatus Thermoplasmatota archaeon]GIR75431.1 MAG: hypothetical protein CM15mP78_01300 [Candidatus Poseidoniales archaeon]
MMTEPTNRRAMNGLRRMSTMSWELVEVACLRPHEQTLPWRVEEMVEKIQRNKYFHKPLLVDRSTMTILDGHHRHQASLRLGLKRVPAMVFDYQEDERIVVEAWPPTPRGSVSKALVVQMAENGLLMEPKSSKHSIHVDIPRLRIPLEALTS